jgi:hypothetical protein
MAHRLCRTSDVRHLPPDIEGLGPDRAIGGGCHEVSPRMEVRSRHRTGRIARFAAQTGNANRLQFPTDRPVFEPLSSFIR